MKEENWRTKLLKKFYLNYFGLANALYLIFPFGNIPTLEIEIEGKRLVLVQFSNPTAETFKAQIVCNKNLTKKIFTLEILKQTYVLPELIHHVTKKRFIEYSKLNLQKKFTRKGFCTCTCVSQSYGFLLFYNMRIT